MNPSVHLIAEVTANRYGLTLADLRVYTRKAKFCRARSLAMYMALNCTDKTPEQIGRVFKRHRTAIEDAGKHEYDERLVGAVWIEILERMG